MFDTIIDFLNRKPLVGIVIIVLFLTILVRMHNDKCKYEGFNNSSPSDMIDSQCVSHLDDVFKQNYEGPSKKVNFRCKIGDKIYYLANTPISDCKNMNQSTGQIELDCNENALVLIPENEIDERLVSYKKKLETNKQICNAQKKILDDSNKQESKNDYPECYVTRQFIHDFDVMEYISSTKKSGDKRQSTKKGVSVPKVDNTNNSYARISKDLYSTKNKLLTCGDYGGDINDAKLSVVEKISNDMGGIIGGTKSYIVVNLFFEAHDTRNGYKLFNTDGTPKIKNLYLSACKDLKCKSNNVEYIRVCLTDNPIDSSILDFEPAIV